MVVHIYNVVLKFIGLGLFNNYQAFIKIYNKSNNLIYHGRTYNGELHINLEINCIYRLVAYTHRKRIVTSFYVTRNKNKYTFTFNDFINNTRIITFILKDANYTNLPIEKGKILFGKDN